MQPYLKLFTNEKSNCPFCTDESHAGKRRRYTPRQLRKHFNEVHSLDGKWKLILGEVTRGKRSWYRKIFRDFSLEGPCGCGCGQVIHYPLHTHNHKHVWAMPDHAPPYYASGHLSRLQPDNKGRFKKGIIPFNKGTKGVMKRNSGNFHKGQVSPNFNGGIWNTQGYIYIRSTERHKCGAVKYISRARTVGAQLAGRPLTPNDVVLHLDGNPSNDNPANLKVVNRSESINLNRGKLRAGRRRKLLVEIIPLGRPSAPVASAKDTNIQPLRAMKQEMKAPPRPAVLPTRPAPQAPAPRPLFTTPTCPACGTLIIDRFKDCPRCNPDHEHLPPSPKAFWARRAQEDQPVDEEAL